MFVDDADIKNFFINGFIISFVFTCFVFACLYLNPWLWFEDYPEDIREMIANPPDYTTQKIIIGLMGIIIIVGMIVRSSFKWAKKNSHGVKFIHVFIYVFLMYQFVNLWDLIVIDWLIFTWMTPEFVVIPGTEGAEGYNN